MLAIVGTAAIANGGKQLKGALDGYEEVLGNGPAGTPPCPPGPASVEGTIEADDVIGPAAQGIAPGELGELMRAIRAGVT